MSLITTQEAQGLTRIYRWIDRKFNFDFPAELYPNLIARLRGTPIRLQEAVRNVPRERLTQCDDGRWSIQENAGHLLDEESLFTRRLQEFLSGATILTPAPYLSVELKHNRCGIEEILSGFQSARSGLVANLE